MKTFAAVRLAALVAMTPLPASAQLAEECEYAPDGPSSLVVGAVECLRIDSAMLGGPTPVSYYVPPGCDPANLAAAGERCPVLYYLHGTGGSYREGTGSRGTEGNAWIRALTHGPPVDPRTVEDPTAYANPSTWVEQAPIEMIVVAPHGMTLEGGHGPAPGQETFWFDWNPKYAQGGEFEKYATPPPRAGSYLQEELVAYVDAHFPTIADRTGRAIVGYSMGGIGSYTNGFQRPDLWSSQGMRSGGSLPDVWLTDLVDPGVPLAPPAEVPYVAIPGTVSFLANPVVWGVLYGPVLTTGFGDPALDNIWYRGNQPGPLATNVTPGGADDRQATHLKHFVNDAIPRTPDDDVVGFETILYPTNVYLEQVFDHLGVERTFDVGPGDHSSRYAQPYYRKQLEQQYANLRHRDGGGAPRSEPETFVYRSIRDDFTIWGWRFEVDRDAVEFLHVEAASCDGVTLRGTGIVKVTPKPACGAAPVVVDLGPGQPVDEHASLGNSGSWGQRRSVAFP